MDKAKLAAIVRNCVESNQRLHADKQLPSVNATTAIRNDEPDSSSGSAEKIARKRSSRRVTFKDDVPSIEDGAGPSFQTRFKQGEHEVRRNVERVYRTGAGRPDKWGHGPGNRTGVGRPDRWGHRSGNRTGAGRPDKWSHGPGNRYDNRGARRDNWGDRGQNRDFANERARSYFHNKGEPIIELYILVGQQLVCRVMHVEAHDRFTVQLDVGDQTMAEATNLPKELSVFHYQALQCTLHNYTAQAHTLMSLDEMKTNLTGKKSIVYVDAVDGDILVTTLYDAQTGQKLALFTPDEGAYDAVVPLCMRGVFNFNFGLAYISHVETLNELYLQTSSDEDRLATLLDQLYTFYQEGSPSPLCKLEADALCAALSSDGNWYRTTVLSAVGDQVHVHFTDYGNSETVPKDSVRKLDPQFYEPYAFALAVSLGLDAVHNDALAKLTEWTTDKALQVTLSFGPDGWLASLNLDGVDISMRLVNEKLAVPLIDGTTSGELGKVPDKLASLEALAKCCSLGGASEDETHQTNKNSEKDINGSMDIMVTAIQKKLFKGKMDNDSDVVTPDDGIKTETPTTPEKDLSSGTLKNSNESKNSLNNNTGYTRSRHQDELSEKNIESPKSEEAPVSAPAKTELKQPEKKAKGDNIGEDTIEAERKDEVDKTVEDWNAQLEKISKLKEKIKRKIRRSSC